MGNVTIRGHITIRVKLLRYKNPKNVTVRGTITIRRKLLGYKNPKKSVTIRENVEITYLRFEASNFLVTKLQGHPGLPVSNTSRGGSFLLGCSNTFIAQPVACSIAGIVSKRMSGKVRLKPS